MPTIERLMQDNCQGVRSQPGLHGDCYPSLSYTVRLCQKKKSFSLCVYGGGGESKEENV